jgi:DNA repair protein RecO (recombination protein O)
MALVKSRAISLRTYRLGETSKVVVCYTRDYGKVKLVAKGARKGGGRLGAALEPMVVSGVVFYLKQTRDLNLVSQAEIERQWPELRRDVVRMAYAGAALELTDALVSGREPDPALFDQLESMLEKAATVPESLLDVALWTFELSLAAALGYSPELANLPDVSDGDIPTVVRDEIGEALKGFLEEHAGHELKLRSLEFLAQVRRTGHRPDEPEQ